MFLRDKWEPEVILGNRGVELGKERSKSAEHSLPHGDSRSRVISPRQKRMDLEGSARVKVKLSKSAPRAPAVLGD